jgi:peroxiredoxin
MMKRLGTLLVIVLSGMVSFAQGIDQTGAWFGELLREDGKKIRFHFDIRKEKNKPVLYIINAAERLKVDRIRFKKDSVFFEMPVFESVFRARILSKDQWQGSWTKGTSTKPQVMPFLAYKQSSVPVAQPSKAVADITGRWAITFTKPDQKTRPAIGEWQQKGNTLHGTVLTPTGDYRYLTGLVSDDSLQLSTFDGSHAFLLTAKIDKNNKLVNGYFYSGATGVEPWVAYKDANAVLPDIAAMQLKDGEEKLHFRFPGLDKKMVSINDPKFVNKVVVIQIMGSWCPNCMDETAFLSDYYRQNKQRGIEIIGLAYEYSTDWERSKASIQKFKDRFHVQYPILNTGVTVSDSLRTEKTLPELTQIKSFPSTIFIDKKGRVAKIVAGFEGPGTGIHYAEMKKEFEATVDRLLKE